MQLNTIKNSIKNKEMINKANKSFAKNEFSFSFNRTMNFEKNLDYTEFILRKTFSSTEFITLLNYCLGIELTKMNDLFITLYKPSNFLAPQSDVHNGVIAITISLTKD